MDKYILVLDEGTTGVRAIIFDKESNIISQSYQEITNIFPNSGWCEQDPIEIWEKSIEVIKESLSKTKIQPQNIASIGITNQRGTNLLWDKKRGKPLYNAITWQDVRATKLCEELNELITMKGLRAVGKVVSDISKICNKLKEIKIGKLLISTSKFAFNPSFSSIQLKWLFENVKEVKEVLNQNNLLFGTLDTWILWKLTDGKVHATDYSNASSTAMFDPFNVCWSNTILGILKIPKTILPIVKESSDFYGKTEETLLGSAIPITSVVADQQSALFGECCYESGEVKCTIGTGAFIDLNTGENPMISMKGLLPLIGWKLNGKLTYMMEGYVSMAGSAIKWLCDGLNLINRPEESEKIAFSVKDTNGLYVVPAFSGLTSPYWDPKARGIVVGISRGTTKEHIIRATLEGIVYRCKDIINTMEEESKIKIKSIRVDGGVARNNFVLQFLADMLQLKVIRANNIDVTALGAAYLAGLKIGYWNSLEEIKNINKLDVTFTPQIGKEESLQRYKNWQRAVLRSLNWNI